MSDRQRVPVFVVTGLLGSGKTTLLTGLLQDRHLADSLVIVNELAPVGLDHHLVADPGEDVILLDNGCLCCAMQGDLVTTLRAVAQRIERGGQRFARVLVETTGVADPAGVLVTLVADPVVAAYMHVGAVLCVVDAVHWEEQLREAPEALRQIAAADHLLISKTDMITVGEQASVLDALSVLTTAPTHFIGTGDPGEDLVRLFTPSGGAAGLGVGVDWLEPRARGVDPRTATATVAGTPARGHDVSGLMTVVLRRDRPVTGNALLLWLNLLGNFHGGRLLRVKGILDVEGRPTLVNGVRQVIHRIVTLRRWPGAERTSTVVFIGHDVRREALSAVNDVLGWHEITPSQGLDPARYRALSSLFARMRR